MSKSCREIRDEFLAFFERRGHAFVPSSPLLPAADPTLLFANAGMNQFKDIFLGLETRDYTRAVNTQKCIRAGGKHNDLEDVGHDCCHHTFFEMLGNWSFGDYFKAEAIAWAWELLTGVWSLPADRLHATYFRGDEKLGLSADTESRELWAKYLPARQIHPGDKKDNFWEMGKAGPCGPCSEIHIDLTDDASGARLVNAGDPRVMEIWNLVFIQFNRSETGGLAALPATHVDTGMGLERICAVLQGKKSNYATDLFVPIIEKIETLCEHRYGATNPKSEIRNRKLKIGNQKSKDRFDTTDTGDMGDVACRVISDHARALTFAIADGVIPSNEGRGYVLRRILRRAARYGRQYLDIAGPFLVELVPTIIDLMGETFGEIVGRKNYVIETIRQEEESFGRTLDRGIELFQKQADALREVGRKTLPGPVVFDLYATFGFPVDLTQIMAGEVGLKVDLDGYARAMESHRRASSAGGGKFKAEAIPDLPATDDSSKYGGKPIAAKVLGWVVDGKYQTGGELTEAVAAAIVLDRTNFYAEQGGQVGDAGELMGDTFIFDVEETRLAGRCVLHAGKVRHGTVRPGLSVTAKVCPRRMNISRNHTATHLLNWALREVLGGHVSQAGSVVGPDRLRFDFSHSRAVTQEQLEKVERMVNELIMADEPVRAEIKPLAEAKKIPGVRAVFGEKYPDPVRVISVGSSDPLSEPPVAVEFCGGTHVESTGVIERFRIVSERSVAKGVRRIVAVTGRDGVEAFEKAEAERLAEKDRQKERSQMEKAARAAAAEANVEADVIARTPCGNILVARLGSADAGAMRNLCDRHRQKGAAAMMIGGAAPDNDKVTLVAMVSDELVENSDIRASDWVKAVCGIVGGGGGGKDTMATAGGRKPAKLDDALAAAGEWIRAKL